MCLGWNGFRLWSYEQREMSVKSENATGMKTFFSLFFWFMLEHVLSFFGRALKWKVEMMTACISPRVMQLCCHCYCFPFICFHTQMSIKSLFIQTRHVSRLLSDTNRLNHAGSSLNRNRLWIVKKRWSFDKGEERMKFWSRAEINFRRDFYDPPALIDDLLAS